MLRDVTFQRNSALQIQHSLALGGSVAFSEPYTRSALFLPGTDTFHWLEVDGAPPRWLEVATELARVFRIDPASSSAHMRAVLQAADPSEAEADLDEVGIPAIDAALAGNGAPAVVDVLGVDEQWVDPDGSAERSGPASATAPADPASAHESEEAPVDRAGDDTRRGAGGSPEAEEPEGAASNAGGATTDRQVSDPDGREGSQNGKKSRAGTRSSGGERQSRLRSYVSPFGGTAGEDGGSTSDGADVDRAAVDAVLAYEARNGRDPTEMKHENPDFDVVSRDDAGHIRYIEVKGTRAGWGETGVGLSRRQYRAGREHGDDFWLYVVDRATTDPTVNPIRNPVALIDQYLFDDGWLAMCERDVETRPALPELLVAASPDGMRAPVPVRSVDPGSSLEGVGWITSPSNEDVGTFAVRILGDALGLAFRGGLAFAEPMSAEPEEDDELLLVRLSGQIDPDTGSEFCVRIWRPERDLAGKELALRLWSSSSVAPLTVDDRPQLRVVGRVRRALRASELEELGLLADG